MDVKKLKQTDLKYSLVAEMTSMNSTTRNKAMFYRIIRVQPKSNMLKSLNKIRQVQTYRKKKKEQIYQRDRCIIKFQIHYESCLKTSNKDTN